MTNAEKLCKDTYKLAEKLSFVCTICPLDKKVECEEEHESGTGDVCRDAVKKWLEREVTNDKM